MADLETEITKAFGNKLRLRISGVCIENDSVLLIKHLSIGKKGVLWAPPGGGLHYGESITDSLKREFLEETGLQIEPGELILVNEYLESPLHAVELFFKVRRNSGDLVIGTDPEMPRCSQIIAEIRFIPFHELLDFDPETLHSMFKLYKTAQDFERPVMFQQNIVKQSE